MRPHDTSEEAWAVQMGLLRGAGPEARLRMALQMSDDVREITRCGIRSRHPKWSEDDVDAELVRIVHGKALAKRLLG